MSNIVLTPEQLQVLNQSAGPVVVVDSNGKTVGQVTRRWFSDREIADAERRIHDKEPSYTLEEVFEHLRSLEPS